MMSFFFNNDYKKIVEENNNLKSEILELQTQISRKHAFSNEEHSQEGDFSRHLLKVLIDTLPHSIYFKDLESRFIFCNTSMAKASGFNMVSEMLGKTDFDIFSHEHATQAFEDEQQIMLTKEPLLNIVEQETWENKPNTWVSTSKFPLFGINGELIGTFGISQDVTEVVKSQKELQQAHEELENRVKERTIELFESNEKYKLITDNSFDFIFQLDKNGRFVFVSQSIKTLLKYDSEDVVGESFDILIDSEYKEKGLPDFSELLEGKKTSFSYVPLRTKDNNLLWFDISVSPVMLNSEVDFFICVARDVTATRGVQEELILLKRAVENSPVTILITDSRGIIQYVNKKFVELTGYSVEEALGKSPSILRSGKMDRKVYDALWSSILEGNEWRGELLNKKKNGDLYWEYGYISGVRNISGEVTHFIAIKEDITDSKRQEEEHKLNEARLNTIISILQQDFDNIELLLESALEEALKMLSSKIGYIYFYDEQTERFTLNSWSKSVMDICKIREPNTICGLENTGIWGEVVRQRKSLMINDMQAMSPLRKGYPEGHAELHNFLSVPIYENDKIVAVVGVANKEGDYTSSDELQLRLLMNSIWLLVSSINVNHKLKVTNQELVEINSQRDRLFSIISHDLRSPFMVLINLSQILSERFNEFSDAERKEYLDIITDSSEKTFNLLENLLEWSRAKRGLVTFNPVKIELLKLSNDVLRTMSFQFKVKKLNVTAQFSESLYVMADEKMLRSILRNLLSNSAKFTPQGGSITILAQPEGESVKIVVRDTGIGMEKLVADSLFTFDANNVHEGLQGEKGSGLGLILCQEFVELHGGEIKVESILDKGSDFIFTLPGLK